MTLGLECGLIPDGIITLSGWYRNTHVAELGTPLRQLNHTGTVYTTTPKPLPKAQPKRGQRFRTKRNDLPEEAASYCVLHLPPNPCQNADHVHIAILPKHLPSPGMPASNPHLSSPVAALSFHIVSSGCVDYPASCASTSLQTAPSRAHQPRTRLAICLPFSPHPWSQSWQSRRPP